MIYVCIGILLTLYINILRHAVLIALRFNGHRSVILTSLLGRYRAMQKTKHHCIEEPILEATIDNRTSLKHKKNITTINLIYN
jgi:hypothetical protein